jgi:hypothetical protein
MAIFKSSANNTKTKDAIMRQKKVEPKLAAVQWPVILMMLAFVTNADAQTIRSDLISVTVDQGRYAIQAQGQATPFASGALRYQGSVKVVPVIDSVFGKGQAIEVTAANGAGESFQVFPRLPFVLQRSILVNTGTVAIVLNKVPLMEAALDLGTPADQLVALGTGGLKPLAQTGGSYAWMAVANPATRAGVMGGWLTYERGSGVVFTKLENGKLNLESRLEYGHLRIEPGQSVASETFLIGWFADARLGLEAWADAVARHMAIKLPPMPIVYCTWYDNVHGGPSNAKALAELGDFAAKALKPYGLSCVQIDDGWQMGDPKGNGPRKNFSAYNPNGPYPNGMKPTADALKADGFTAGLWILPFGGSWNDPFFASHQDWFVKKEDGKPFDTAWGGTALDMTQSGARNFVKGEVQQAVHDWGYHYLKLDGLSTGAGVQPQYVNDSWKEDNLGDAVFHDPSKANIEVFRDGLRLIRKAAGPQTFLLGCCAPQNMRSYAGAFGLVNAMRVGPDNGGDWGSWRGSSPDFGSRNYHLNGRIWWDDPDPIYVRASIPLESARCIASWNAISGEMISLSDWLPALPEERLDIIRRCIPGHGVTSRPIDLFNTWPPQQWLVTDQRPDHQRRDVVGLFNWSNDAEHLSLPVSGLGLPLADEYVPFDFWNGELLQPFQGTLELNVPGAACRILAVRPLLPRPFLISTSRHVSQGILEVKKEVWDASAKTLIGTSAVVADDVYELRVVARAPTAGWTLVKAEVSAGDAAAGVTITATGVNGLVRAVIKSPVSRDVEWTLGFASGKVTDASVPSAAHGTALTLISPQDYQVCQRASKDKGVIAIGGEFTGPAHAILAAGTPPSIAASAPLHDQWYFDDAAKKTTIEARLVADGEAGAWRKLPAKFDGAKFSTVMDAPAGGWYRLEVRVLSDGKVLAQSSVEHVGMGEVFVVAGQSNSANYGEEKQKTKTGRVASFDGKGWQLGNDPQRGATGGSGSFMPPFGDAIVEQFHVPVGLIACGIGATSVREWLPKGTTFPNPPTIESRVAKLPDGTWESKGEAYEMFIGRMKQFGPRGFRAVLWHEGESDANQPDPRRTLPGRLYRQYLEKLIQDSRHAIGWDAPWFVAQVSYHVPGDESSPDIRAAQAEVWKDGMALEGPDTDALKGNLRQDGGKGVHFSGPGLREHAARWVEKVAPWLEQQLK